MERLTEWNSLAGVMTGDLKTGVDERRAFDRLAAYEDTGMTPEEIKDVIEIFHSYRHILAGFDPDHIRELVQAKKAGRLVVLPCKVGDTVYRVFHVRGREPVIAECEIKTIGQAADLIGRIGKKSQLVSVFLTREEAEAALEGGVE